MGATNGAGETEIARKPPEILQRRYARGDIGRAEYEEKRKDLSR